MQEQNQRLTKIYYLVSSRNLLNVRYVGKTVMSLNNRLSSHKSGKCGQYLKNWLSKELSEATKQKLREATLNQFLTKGHPNRGRIQTEETRMKIRNALIEKTRKPQIA